VSRGAHEERSLAWRSGPCIRHCDEQVVQVDIKGEQTFLNVKSLPQTNLILLRSIIQLIVLVEAIERPIERAMVTSVLFGVLSAGRGQKGT